MAGRAQHLMRPTRCPDTFSLCGFFLISRADWMDRDTLGNNPVRVLRWIFQTMDEKGWHVPTADNMPKKRMGGPL